ncbi:DNA-binding response regulator [Paenibacillus nanensis]|uniref:DNA-binding response regulator n=1 Tax=Paenibacillus nanensis TaxID=393251 RepID=A0A3A1UYZ1_9BACL|nr:response regulator transcription factor [Paenibacillus nanensis]RIX52651.1 DNA-binding response regulator [Paenibacillus nanensis]
MIKVLIVDDEPKQREGLRAFIDWQSYGYIVVDTASSGNEAIEKYKAYRPDLVITDIRMPGMDGLQLTGQLRAMDAKLHFLILSGYADFEYAKKAMAYKADGYLMKPVDEEELIEYLKKIKDQIDREKSSERWQHVSKEWGREAFIRSLLTGASEQNDRMEEEARELGLLWNSYQVLLLSLKQGEDEELEPAVLTGLWKRLSAMFEQTGRGFVFMYQAKIGVLLKEPILSVETEDVYQDIRKALEGTGTDFSASLGHKVCAIRDVASSYASARDLNKKHFFIGEGKLLCPDMQEKKEASASGDDSRSAETCKEQLYYALEVGNKETMQALLRRMGESLVAEGYGEAAIKRRFVELLTSILAKGIKDFPQLQSWSNDHSDFIADIYNARTLEAIYNKSGYFLEQMMSQLSKGGNHHEVKMMLDIINRNFSDNLKLETLSGIFNYNSAYLGKLFKNATGEYFNTYLDKVRIEKAKALLEEGMKVYQVAEKVGYTNVDYFHTKFRKYVGTSPSAYRKTVSHA